MIAIHDSPHLQELVVKQSATTTTVAALPLQCQCKMQTHIVQLTHQKSKIKNLKMCVHFPRASILHHCICLDMRADGFANVRFTHTLTIKSILDIERERDLREETVYCFGYRNMQFTSASVEFI